MKSFFRTPDRRKKYILMAGDFFSIALSLLLTFVFQIAYRAQITAFITPFKELPPSTLVVAIINLSILFIGLCVLIGFIYISIYFVMGLYEIRVLFNRKLAFVKSATGIFCGAFFGYVFIDMAFGGIFIIQAWAFHLCSLMFILLGWHYVFFTKLNTAKPYEVLFIQKDALVEKAMAYLSSHRGSRLFHFRAFSKTDFFKNGSVPEIQNGMQNGYSMIVFPYLNDLNPEELILLIRKKFESVSLCNSLTFYKNSTGRFPVFDMDSHWLINLSTSLSLSSRFQQRIKRTIDILFSLVGLLLSFPIMVMSGLAIKLTSKGPVLYIHERLGLHERPFRIYKFRTMIDNAEKTTGPMWAKKDDPRVTPLGKFLRKTRVDELPQFLNVLKGEMSFVGPRPIRKVFEDKYSESVPYYFLRHLIRPGLTGWAQVNDFDPRAEDGPLRRLEYDLFYMHEYSFLLDAVIVLKTIQRVLGAKGQ